VNPACTRQGLEQRGFAGAVLAYEKGYGCIKAQGFRFVEYRQTERVVCGCRECFLKQFDTFQVVGHNPSLRAQDEQRVRDNGFGAEQDDRIEVYFGDLFVQNRNIADGLQYRSQSGAIGSRHSAEFRQ